MIADRAFTERVLERVSAVEARRQRRENVRPLLPIATILVVGGAWAIALFDGVIALRLLIEVTAWVNAVGSLEQRLSASLLGPFALIPLLVSLLLFVAAIVWVRAHQQRLLDREP